MVHVADLFFFLPFWEFSTRIAIIMVPVLNPTNNKGFLLSPNPHHIFFCQILNLSNSDEFRVVEVSMYLLAKKVECILRCYFGIFVLFIFKPLFISISHFLIDLFVFFTQPFEFFVYYRYFFQVFWMEVQYITTSFLIWLLLVHRNPTCLLLCK